LFYNEEKFSLAGWRKLNQPNIIIIFPLSAVKTAGMLGRRRGHFFGPLLLAKGGEGFNIHK
jgi:hypothetical protein